jgi:hypothetical protein
MRTQLIKIVLAASILLAYAFTASCSMLEENNDSSSSSGTGSGAGPGSSSSGGGNQGNGQGSAFNLNSQIAADPDCEYDGDIDDFICTPATYTSNGFVEDDSYRRIATVTNGRVVGLQLQSITIPDADSYEFSSPFYFDEEDIATYCSQYTDISVYGASFGLKDSDDDPAGRLQIRDEEGNNKIFYWYSFSPGKIVCSMDSEYGSEKYNLDIKVGWNEIYLNVKYTEDYYSTTEYSTSNILTKPVAWYIISYYPGY